jgi:hypothetical protein
MLRATQTNLAFEDTQPFHTLPFLCGEVEVLLCCGGPQLQARNAKRLSELVASDLDWNRVFQLALGHHMVPLLYWNLSHRALAVPSPVMDALKNLFIRNVGRSLSMTGELLAILEDMERQNVIAVPYKGPVLASRIYGNIALRQSVDLDILVRRNDVVDAREILLSRGYSPHVMLDRSNHEFQVESRYSEIFVRSDSTVELHWAFTNRDVAFPLSLDDLLARLERHEVAGKSFPVFCPEDTLLILCVHGAKHGWNRLEWICGIAELIHEQVQLDWTDLLSRAIATGGSRRLFLGLALAHDLYGAQIPDRLKQDIRDNHSVIEMTGDVTAALFNGQDKTSAIHSFGTIDHDLFHYRLGDRLPERLRYVFYRVTTPSRPEKWSTISIAGRSLTLHAITRPFTVVLKLIPALWRLAPWKHGS